MTTQTLRTEGWSICHAIIEFVYDGLNVIQQQRSGQANSKSPNYNNTNITNLNMLKYRDQTLMLGLIIA